MARLVHTGSVIVDVVMRVDRLPDRGGDTVASESRLTAGGALNSMVAARLDGLAVLYAGLSGTGPFGTIVASALADHGIAALYPPVRKTDSGFCVALVEADGERTFVTHVGAEGDYGYEQLAGIPLAAGDLVYVSGYSLATPGNAAGLARWLPEVPRGIPVFVDPSPLVAELPRELYRPLLERADVLSCNARETRLLTGESDLDAAARALAGMLHPGAAAVVRAGAQPCRVARAGAEAAARVRVFPVRAVDTSGAGDAHAGVLLAGLARGLGIEDAVLRANAAASLAVRVPGPASAPTADQIDRLLGSH